MKRIVRLLERFARHVLVYPLLRLFLHNPYVPIPLDIRTIRRILILRYDRIGDIVVTTPVFRLLKRANPGLKIGVLASPSNAELILDNPHVDHVHVLHSNWIALGREIRKAHEERYDVVLNLIFNRTTSGGLLANLIAPRGIKIGQGAEKYRFYFNVLLQLSRGSKHMTEVLGDIVAEVFGIPVKPADLRLELSVDKRSEDEVGSYLNVKKIRRRQTKDRKRETYVVFNLSATDEVRRISEEQARLIVKILVREMKCPTVVIAAPSDREWRDGLVGELRSGYCWSYPQTGNANLREIGSLIHGAAAVITPDTAVVHLASAAKTPVLGFFTPLQVAAEWLPFKVKHTSVLAKDGMPVSSIDETTLRSHLVKFMKQYGGT